MNAYADVSDWEHHTSTAILSERAAAFGASRVLSMFLGGQSERSIALAKLVGAMNKARVNTILWGREHYNCAEDLNQALLSSCTPWHARTHHREKIKWSNHNALLVAKSGSDDIDNPERVCQKGLTG
jgi:hypothetical protein